MSNEYLFDREENEQRKQAMFEIVKSGEAVLFVGAGISEGLGYPNWNKLLDDLYKYASDCGYMSDIIDIDNDQEFYYQKRAQQIINIFKKSNAISKYKNFISDAFKPRDIPKESICNKLVQLPFRGIITTNYDPSLEIATRNITPEYESGYLMESKDIGKFMKSLLNKKPPRIAYLHGKYDRFTKDSDGRDFILGMKDYETSYGIALVTVEEKELLMRREELIVKKWTLHLKFLWSIFASRPTIFLGFSLNDAFIKLVLKTVCSDLWQWEQNHHFIVMSREEHQYKKKDAPDLGLKIIHFENPKNDYKELETIIDNLINQCREASDDSNGSQEKADLDKPFFENQTLPSTTLSISSGSNWREKINKRMTS